MGSETIKAVLLAMIAVAVVVALDGRGATATTLCNVTDSGFAACKPSVTQPNPVSPSPECCGAISGADLGCLCKYRHSIVLPALGINPELVMALPAKCNLTSPTKC